MEWECFFGVQPSLDNADHEGLFSFLTTIVTHICSLKGGTPKGWRRGYVWKKLESRGQFQDFGLKEALFSPACILASGQGVRKDLSIERHGTGFIERNKARNREIWKEGSLQS